MDWGHAADHIRGLCLIAHVYSPEAFIVASGELNLVQNFDTHVFDCLGFDFDTYVDGDPILIRSVEPQADLVGNSERLRRIIG